MNSVKDSINSEPKKASWKTIKNLNKIAANLQDKLKLRQDIIEIRTITWIIAEKNGPN